jgi:hypothetical protein
MSPAGFNGESATWPATKSDNGRHGQKIGRSHMRVGMVASRCERRLGANARAAIVFYSIDEDEVFVVRILYGRQG